MHASPVYGLWFALDDGGELNVDKTLKQWTYGMQASRTGIASWSCVWREAGYVTRQAF